MYIVTLLFDFKHVIGEKLTVKLIELSKYDKMEQVLAWGLQTFLCGGPVLSFCLCRVVVPYFSGHFSFLPQPTTNKSS